MKKVSIRFIPLLVILLFLIQFALAVPSFSATINYGFKGGFNLGKLTSEPQVFVEGYPWKTKLSFVAGTFISLEIKNSLFIQPEVLYIQKGAKLIDSENKIEARFNLDYIEIPILLKANIKLQDLEDSLLVPSIYLGPFVGFNNKANLVLDDGYSKQTEDIKADLKSTEFGMTFGLQLAQPWGAGTFSIEARYDLGLSNVMKSGSELLEKMKTKAVVLMLGYYF